MPRRAIAISLLPAIVLSVLLTAQASDKRKNKFYLKPDQKLDLADARVVPAKQNCENWALAAGLETMLARQNVPLSQNFWVMRLNHGEICVDKLPTIDWLAEVVNSDFVLDDGRHVRLELHFVPGAPTDVDSVLAAIKHDRPVLMLWRGHPYYLTGATYDEHIRGDGMRFYEIKELRLADTLGGAPATFQKKRDNADEIDGIITVSATEL